MVSAAGASSTRTRAWVTVALFLLVLVGTASACGSESSGGAPGPPPTSTPSVNPFAAADRAMATMVQAQATWHAARAVDVDTTTEVGLSIGDTAELRRQIEANLPNTPTTDAGTLTVGPDVSAVLVADEDAASVYPSDAVDASTGSDIGLLWTWSVHPRRPAEELRLTARVTMTVPGTDHVMTQHLPLTMQVRRTAGFTVHQVFTNWMTWAAICTTVLGFLRWGWPRLRRYLERRRTGGAYTSRLAPSGS